MALAHARRHFAGRFEIGLQRDGIGECGAGSKDTQSESELERAKRFHGISPVVVARCTRRPQSRPHMLEQIREARPVRRCRRNVSLRGIKKGAASGAHQPKYYLLAIRCDTFPIALLVANATRNATTPNSP
ncbi:hypothetical protein PUN4_600027 [Paraburkholderia unamae]|nr:hypothetical protein PUN4_600027 [Paraburkholderia unamae]